jgi:hypothetical protein
VILVEMHLRVRLERPQIAEKRDILVGCGTTPVSL